MRELGGYRAQAELDVAQAFAMRQLGEGYAEPLIPIPTNLLYPCDFPGLRKI
jgi:hypothetical protein